MLPRRKSARRMCPNPECASYQQPTSMMGGCACGSALVEYYIAPDDDQLERFILVLMRQRAKDMGFPASEGALMFAAGMTMLDPAKKATYLAEHRRYQQMANEAA